MTRFTSLRALVLALVVHTVGCTGDGDARPSEPPAASATLDGAIQWQREFRLDENEKTINVIVRAEIDPRGGYLIADEQEGFARRYDPNGRLLAQFGGKGQGPGEFLNLLRVVRLSDGTLAAFDIFNKIAFFDSAGTQVLRTTRTPVSPLHSVALLNDSVVILGGEVKSNSRGGRVHLWNLNSETLLASFFAPPLPSPAHEIASASAGWISVDRKGDTLAVLASLSDTVYLMTTSGRMLERIPVPAKHFRPLRPGAPPPDGRGGLAAVREWFGSFSLMSDVFWIGDTFLVQYQDRKGPQPSWRLVGMKRDGRRTFEAVDTPNLLTVDRRTGLLYFVAPGSPSPDTWRAARLIQP